jgi:hypothetical protein
VALQRQVAVREYESGCEKDRELENFSE